MVRTQIYLTEHQRDELAAIARNRGKRKSEVIREAIDRFLDQTTSGRRAAVLQETAGMWKNRTDVLDFEAIRAEWDRF